jgi:microcystin-dependent protein
MPFAMNSVPTGWLAANGTAVSRTTYAALFAAIGTTYGAGTGGTTFNLPDLRGYFVRGVGTNSDGTAAGTFGAKQADAVIAHTHSGTTGGMSANESHKHGISVTGLGLGGGGGNPVQSTNTYGVNNTSITNTSTAHTHSFSTSSQSPAGTAETRPNNIAMLYCIKF